MMPGDGWGVAVVATVKSSIASGEEDMLLVGFYEEVEEVVNASNSDNVSPS